jgi:hypothetical protein
MEITEPPSEAHEPLRSLMAIPEESPFEMHEPLCDPRDVDRQEPCDVARLSGGANSVNTTVLREAWSARRYLRLGMWAGRAS